MPTFFSPEGNPEIWETKPEGYFTQEEWEALHPPPPPEPPTMEQMWAARLADIQAFLDQSDLTIIRCYENGVPVPPEWGEYRSQLRSLLKITDGNPDLPLPARPPYPEGS